MPSDHIGGSVTCDGVVEGIAGALGGGGAEEEEIGVVSGEGGDSGCSGEAIGVERSGYGRHVIAGEILDDAIGVIASREVGVGDGDALSAGGCD